MRALNEPIARWANREDGCTGKFWEGRFKCQALLDESAVLSCMTYVDLNPVRAGICDQLKDSNHTSGQRRLRKPEKGESRKSGHRNSLLRPVAGLTGQQLFEMTESGYMDLVQWTGEQARPDKHGKLVLPGPDTPVPEAMWTAARHPREWMRQVQDTESRYYRAIGSAEALILKAKDLGQHWMKGLSGARALQLLRQTP